MNRSSHKAAEAGGLHATPAATGADALAGPPVAPRIPTERHAHGEVYIDEREWLRDADEKQLRALLEAENAWTAERTAHLAPLEEAFFAEISAHSADEDTSVPYREGAWWYYTRTRAEAQYPAVYRRRDEGGRPAMEDLGSAGSEECVWDGNALASGRDFFSTSTFRPSPDGRLGALGCDHAGSEHYTLRIFDIAKQVVLDDSLEHVGYGLAWAADSQHIIHTRVDAAWRSWQVWVHPVGHHEGDHLVYQENDPRFEVSLHPSRDGKWAVIHASSPTTTEVRLLSLADPFAEPLLICPRESGLDYSVEPAGDELLIVHNARSADFELACAPLGTSGPDDWHTLLFPEQGERIAWVDSFREYAVVSMRSAGAPQLRVLARRDGEWGPAHAVATEPHATLDVPVRQAWDSPTFCYTCESVALPLRTIEYNPATGESTVIKETPAGGLDPAAYRAHMASAPAPDGTAIPLTIFYRAGMEPDGTHPGLLYGYGAYEIPNDPYYRPALLSLLDRGVVVAYAHVRGGGELGRAWYEGGKELAKRNSFTDFLACARYLKEEGWVAPDRLAAQGRSAGGLLVGAAMNMAPEEFCAVHAGVPFVDALTTILNPDLPLTAGEWEEWGNPVESAEVYEYMKSYSPVENVVEGAIYPAVLATASLHDIRVSWVEPTKWVQVLREGAANDPYERPILERIELAGGHAGASGRDAKRRQEAFEHAWIADRLGISAEQVASLVQA